MEIAAHLREKAREPGSEKTSWGARRQQLKTTGKPHSDPVQVGSFWKNSDDGAFRPPAKGDANRCHRGGSEIDIGGFHGDLCPG